MDERHWLEYVYALHGEWLKIAKLYNGGAFAEDLVQDMYLKLHKYANPDKFINNGKVNKGYVFFALKSVINDYHNKKLITTDELPYDLADEQTADFEGEWWDFCQSVEDIAKGWKWSDRMIFEHYKLSGQSMRSMADAYGISVTSIFLTLKVCKADLKEKLSDEWEKIEK